MQNIFQSTLPRVERRYRRSAVHAGNRFQSTLPRVERLHQFVTHGLPSLNFNPRSREWSDCTHRLPPEPSTKISIHAPASGATKVLEEHDKRDFISIHAPASGATICGAVYCHPWRISIHAPASGATAFIDIFSFTVRLYFISSH